MKVVLAGGTGSLGRLLADDLERCGEDVVVLTRSPRPEVRHRQVEWDGRTVGPWASELEGALLVNLAGELVDRRPTARNVRLLTASRVEPTLALVAAAAEARPALWLQMSTLAIYGDAGEDPIDEHHPAADGPVQMAGVARAWEAAVEGAPAERLVVMRTGLVLDAGTPALTRLTSLARFGLGGRIASGRQWISWIHAQDLVRAIRFLRDTSTVEGVVHVTSPEPVRNERLMATVRAAVGRGWAPPTPTPLVHLGALVMGTDPALALTGRRCVPRRLLDAGFTFEHAPLERAIDDLLRPRASA